MLRKALLLPLLSLLVVGFGSALTFTTAPVFAQDLQPVKIGISGHAMEYLPAIIAEAEGFTRKHGLDVTHVYLSGGTPTLQALVADEFPIAIESTTLIHAHLQGFDPVVVASFIHNLPYHFIARGDIRTADDLRGGRVAISTPGAISDGVARMALRTLGLRPEIDAAIIPIGGQTARLAAIEAGTVDATVVSPPLSYQLIEQGYTMLLDLIVEQIPSNHENVITTKKVIRENPDLLKRYIMALGEAIHYIHTNREGTIRHIAEYLQIDLQTQRSLLERTYDGYVPYNIPRKPYPRLEGWETDLAIASLQNEAVLNLDPKDLMDDRIVRELDEEGFFDALYQ